jgi:hypothetical protein
MVRVNAQVGHQGHSSCWNTAIPQARRHRPRYSTVLRCYSTNEKDGNSLIIVFRDCMPLSVEGYQSSVGDVLFVLSLCVRVACNCKPSLSTPFIVHRIEDITASFPNSPLSSSPSSFPFLLLFRSRPLPNSSSSSSLLLSPSLLSSTSPL